MGGLRLSTPCTPTPPPAGAAPAPLPGLPLRSQNLLWRRGETRGAPRATPPGARLVGRPEAQAGWRGAGSGRPAGSLPRTRSLDVPSAGAGGLRRRRPGLFSPQVCCPLPHAVLGPPHPSGLALDASKGSSALLEGSSPLHCSPLSPRHSTRASEAPAATASGGMRPALRPSRRGSEASAATA